MFSFIKKLFGKNNTGYSSNLMDQAMNSTMENDAGRTSVFSLKNHQRNTIML